MVHSERGAATLAELGIDATVIPHPVYPSTAARADDGRTILALGVIRPYKQPAAAVELVRRLPGARLLVAGDAAMALAGLLEAPRTEWRLGYLPPAELERALSDATIALFPYRAELDQSGALLQALGAGCCGRLRRRRTLRTDPALRRWQGRPRGRPRRADRGGRRAAERSRRACLRARRCRTCTERADLGGLGGSRHLPLPESQMIFRRGRFGAVIATQLDLFELNYVYVIEEVNERLEAYNRAQRDEAEELYGDYVDAVETGTELLADMRDAYARSLPEGDDERYEREFNAAVARRLTPFALEIENR